MKFCSIDGCGRKYHARNMCSIHYGHWWHHGDPLAGGTPKMAAQIFLEQAKSYQGKECLIWPYGRDLAGYGRVWKNGRMAMAGRVICEFVHGEAPTPLHEAAHDCGNGHLGCISPKHMKWATRQENVDDSRRHGTIALGERCGTSKLTEANVREIRLLLGTMLQKDIAKLFGISPGTLSSLVHGNTWEWLI